MSVCSNCWSGNCRHRRIRNRLGYVHVFGKSLSRDISYINLLIDARLHREERQRENSLNETFLFASVCVCARASLSPIVSRSLYLFYIGYAHACASIYSCAQAQSKVSLFDYNWWCSSNIILESNPKNMSFSLSFFLFCFSFFYSHFSLFDGFSIIK